MNLRPLAVVVLLAATLVAPPASAQPQSRTWVSADVALVHPGVQTVTEGGQCTANFVFTDTAGDVYIGQSAHCSSTDGSGQTDGCDGATLGLGVPVRIQGASQPGTLVYNSWETMQRVGEADPNTCAFNDFALVRIHPADWAVVNPSMPVFGGPTGTVTTTAAGDTVHTFGNSGLRPDGGAAKTGQAQGQNGDGWNHDVLTLTNPGIPGDSGSGFIDDQGRAFGALSTFEAFPDIGSNGVSDLTLALAYLDRHTDLDVALADGTRAFVADGGGSEGAVRATPVAEVRRLAGAQGTSRVETAVAVGRDDFPADRASTIVIGRADLAADALAASGLAAELGGPLLLTSSGELHPAVIEEIVRVLRRGDTVHVLGGPSAISNPVTDQLTGLGLEVRRLEGASRVETSIAVAQATRPDPSVIVIADGRRFAEPLIAGPLAASRDGVVVLIDGAQPHPAVDEYLGANPDAATIAVGAAAAAAYPDAQPVTAGDEISLSVEVAETFFADAMSFGVARVDVFADALAGGAHIARAAGPVLLTPTDELATSVRDLLSARSAEARQVVLYGGQAALSAEVDRQVRAAVGR